jgi:hypothetical protein
MNNKDANKLYLPDDQKISIDKYNQSLNEVNKLAYKDIYLLSNDTLSRNSIRSGLLNKIHSNANPPERKGYKSIFFMKICNYYLRSCISFFLWILQKVAFIISGYKSESLTNKTKTFTLIDTFFVTANLQKNHYRDKAYLKGLDDILERNNVKYSYLPVFYGTQNPFKYFSIFRGFKKNNIDYITDYELLTFKDIWSILNFIVQYPFHVLSLTKRLNKNDIITRSIKEELFHSLDQVTWRGYARYLTGRHIANKSDKVNLISWCEYQSINKNLYKGIREGNGEVKVFACQFFIKFGCWVNIDIPDSEIEFGITPDLILVNGSSYLKESTNIEHRIGISLRYKKLFESKVNILKNESNLKPMVLLSYVEEESRGILNLMSKSEYADESIYVKAHPALPLFTIKSMIRPNWNFIEGDLYDCFKDVNLVIVAASGTAVEAVAMGKTVIIIGSLGGIIWNPMLNLGKGEIWDVAETAHELSTIKSTLINYRLNNPENIHILACNYKEMLFNDATDTEVLDMFELQQ